MALCQHRMMAEVSASFGRRDTDADPMSADHERLLDRLTDRFGNMITAAVQPLHESQRDTNREIGNIKGTLGEVKGKVDMLVAEREPEDDKTGTATVAMRAITAVESKPWLMIGFVMMFAIAAVAWVLTR